MNITIHSLDLKMRKHIRQCLNPWKFEIHRAEGTFQGDRRVCGPHTEVYILTEARKWLSPRLLYYVAFFVGSFQREVFGYTVTRNFLYNSDTWFAVKCFHTPEDAKRYKARPIDEFRMTRRKLKKNR